jgi:hypothetical protein
MKQAHLTVTDYDEVGSSDSNIDIDIDTDTDTDRGHTENCC